MNEFVVVFVVLAVAVPVVFAAILTLILVVGRSRPEPGLGPSAAAAPGGDGAAAAGGQWNAELTGNGIGALGATFGTFEVTRGVLVFRPDDGQPWQLPCQQIVAQRLSMLNMDGARVSLGTPEGEFRCAVSRERINRFSRNSMKDLRMNRYADEFVQVLLANGARPGA